MKLEHLIQGYNFNQIPAKIKERMEDGKERAGVINFNEDVNASYLIDDEDVVVSLNIFCNCLTKEKSLNSQLEHTIKVIKILQTTIELIDNVSKKEINMILEQLGLFNNTFKDGNKIKHLDHTYKIEVVSGLLMFSVIEILNTPPVKSKR